MKTGIPIRKVAYGYNVVFRLGEILLLPCGFVGIGTGKYPLLCIPAHRKHPFAGKYVSKICLADGRVGD